MDKEHLLLKWGTLKGWTIRRPETKKLLEQYFELGFSVNGVMAQHDTPEQKEVICNIIDAIDGDITSDWSGEQLSKENAKKYVMEYRVKYD